MAVFEPGAKHTFDAAAGKNIANPTAALLASAKMLQVIICVSKCHYIFSNNVIILLTYINVRKYIALEVMKNIIQ